MPHELRHLADRVWLWPHDEDPAVVQGCVAVVADDAGSLLVDAGNSPAAAVGIRAAIDAAGLPPPRRLVYTHHHWDHTWGACAWPDVEVIGHAAGARILAAEADRPWSEAYLREQVKANPRLALSFSARARAMRSWDGFRIVPPHIEFTDTIALPGGVQLHHVGGRHAEDSTVVAVPDSGVVLLGDCFYPPPVHLRAPGDGLDVRLIHALAETYDSYDWFVDSHDSPRSREHVRELLEAVSR